MRWVGEGGRGATLRPHTAFLLACAMKCTHFILLPEAFEQSYLCVCVCMLIFFK